MRIRNTEHQLRNKVSRWLQAGTICKRIKQLLCFGRNMTIQLILFYRLINVLCNCYGNWCFTKNSQNSCMENSFKDFCDPKRTYGSLTIIRRGSQELCLVQISVCLYFAWNFDFLRRFKIYSLNTLDENSENTAHWYRKKLIKSLTPLSHCCFMLHITCP